MVVHDRIEQQAAAWAVRHPLDDQQHRALDEWLGEDAQHAGALLRAQAALSLVDRALLPGAIEAGAIPEASSGSRPSRRWMLAGIGGAMAAAIAGFGVWPRLSGMRVRTIKGEIRYLPLADGSTAAIDSETDLRFALAKDARHVALAQGEAWFHVAKDRHRPFIVDAGIAQARAVGTAFSVRRIRDRVEVSVTEGIVAVWPTEASGALALLHEGQRATFDRVGASPAIKTAPARIERSLAWRNGEISLEGETLRSAVTTFNRYNDQQLVIGDAALGGERLVGLFKINEPGAFAQMLEESLGIVVTVTPREIRLNRRKSGAAMTEKDTPSLSTS